jgi:hypothetical protein
MISPFEIRAALVDSISLATIVVIKEADARGNELYDFALLTKSKTTACAPEQGIANAASPR